MAELRALLEGLGEIPSEKHLQVGRVPSGLSVRSLLCPSIIVLQSVRSIGSFVV